MKKLVFLNQPFFNHNTLIEDRSPLIQSEIVFKLGWSPISILYGFSNFIYIHFTKNILLPTVFEFVKIIVTKMNAVGNNESEETPLLIYNFIFYY